MKPRILVAALTMSAAGWAAWYASEGFTPTPVIPTKGDVPTIGHGSTRYEDGTPVKMSDPPITRKRAEELARNLNSKEEQRFKASLPGVRMTQEEFDLYMDFVGQFGIGNWNKSSMRKALLAGQPRQACNALLLYKFSAGHDCSVPGNRVCYGVWTRQVNRYDKCVAAVGE